MSATAEVAVKRAKVVRVPIEGGDEEIVAADEIKPEDLLKYEFYPLNDEFPLEVVKKLVSLALELADEKRLYIGYTLTPNTPKEVKEKLETWCERGASIEELDEILDLMKENRIVVYVDLNPKKFKCPPVKLLSYAISLKETYISSFPPIDVIKSSNTY